MRLISAVAGLFLIVSNSFAYAAVFDIPSADPFVSEQTFDAKPIPLNIKGVKRRKMTLIVSLVHSDPKTIKITVIMPESWEISIKPDPDTTITFADTKVLASITAKAIFKEFQYWKGLMFGGFQRYYGGKLTGYLTLEQAKQVFNADQLSIKIADYYEYTLNQSDIQYIRSGLVEL